MNPTRLFDLLPHQKETAARPDALACKRNGSWQTYSSEEVYNIVQKVSLGLRSLGIEKGDKVAIVGPNSPEWNFIDFGLQQLGAVSVPMYPTISAEEFRYIFEDAGVKMAFAADQELYQKARTASEGLFESVYTFERVEGAPNWMDVQKAGEGADPASLDALKAQVQPEDLLTLIYTSGTTGRPKGVMLTHSNIMSNARAVSNLFPFETKTAKILSFLPICHIFERTAVYAYILIGSGIYYAENMDTIGDNLKEVKPQMFTTVPRLLEKVYDKIVAKGKELTGIKRKLFFWALELGDRYEPNKQYGAWYNFQLKLARKLIFSKWREALGGNIEMIVSGAAALQPRLARVFWAAGIPVCEAYGLTETSPGISFNRCDPARIRVGTVGELLDGVEVKIADDGEILVKGPNIMKGYYNKPEQTEEVLAGGWFHTGDVGEWVEGKFLRITDRKKEMFKTSGGKYIAPQVLENKLKESNLIEQAMIVGEGERFPAALIVPNLEQLEAWCRHKQLTSCNSTESMLNDPQVLDKYRRELDKANANFGQWEKIKQFRLVHTPWTLEGGELTPTLKLKRKIIHERNQQLIREIYAD